MNASGEALSVQRQVGGLARNTQSSVAWTSHLLIATWKRGGEEFPGTLKTVLSLDSITSSS